MNVLCILTIWNEKKYLPYKVQYCKENKLDLYVIDNMSDDGSWEWLEKHNIPSHRIDTQGAFNLPKLQKEIIKTVHKIKPDWVIYNGCDLFPITTEPLADYIEKMDKKGYNNITMNRIRLCNTGEKRGKKTPFNTYYYFHNISKRNTIYKYHPTAKYKADTVNMKNIKNIKIPGAMLEYGDTKSPRDRNQVYKRRKKAWANRSTPKSFGTHYVKGEQKKWKWNKKHVRDIRKTRYHQYVVKLQDMLKSTPQ